MKPKPPKTKPDVTLEPSHRARTSRNYWELTTARSKRGSGSSGKPGLRANCCRSVRQILRSIMASTDNVRLRLALACALTRRATT